MSRPYIANRSQGANTVRVRSTEFVTDIYAGDTDGSTPGKSVFDLTTFPLNPGVLQTFPWLSQVASSFSQWRPTGVIFTYTSSSGDMTTNNSALGDVIFSTDYVIGHPAPTSKAEMLAQIDSVCAKPSMPQIVHPIECARSQRATELLNVRYPSTDASQFTDLGTLYIATVNNVPNALLGSLNVSYEFEFLKPELFSVVDRLVPGCHYDNYTCQPTPVQPTGFPLGITPPSQLWDNIGLTNFNLTGGARGLGSWTMPATLPSGTYMALAIWTEGNDEGDPIDDTNVYRVAPPIMLPNDVEGLSLISAFSSACGGINATDTSPRVVFSITAFSFVNTDTAWDMNFGWYTDMYTGTLSLAGVPYAGAATVRLPGYNLVYNCFLDLFIIPFSNPAEPVPTGILAP